MSRKKEIQFSIIIPTLNEAKVLEETLKYLKKEIKDFSYEIIISDGDSKDKTLEIAKKHGARITCKKGGNKSIAEGRNLGTKLAKGKYFLFLDADVQIKNLNEFLRQSLVVFEQSKVAAITANVRIFPEEERVQDKIGFTILNLLIWTLNSLGAGAAVGELQLIKREVFEKVGGFDENLITSEDFDMFRRLAKTGRTIFLPHFTAYMSGRRFRKEGGLRILGRFLLNFLWYKLFHQSLLPHWPEVR